MIKKSLWTAVLDLAWNLLNTGAGVRAGVRAGAGIGTGAGVRAGARAGARAALLLLDCSGRDSSVDAPCFGGEGLNTPRAGPRPFRESGESMGEPTIPGEAVMKGKPGSSAIRRPSLCEATSGELLWSPFSNASNLGWKEKNKSTGVHASIAFLPIPIFPRRNLMSVPWCNSQYVMTFGGTHILKIKLGKILAFERCVCRILNCIKCSTFIHVCDWEHEQEAFLSNCSSCRSSPECDVWKEERRKNKIKESFTATSL